MLNEVALSTFVCLDFYFTITTLIANTKTSISPKWCVVIV